MRKALLMIQRRLSNRSRTRVLFSTPNSTRLTIRALFSRHSQRNWKFFRTLYTESIMRILFFYFVSEIFASGSAHTLFGLLYGCTPERFLHSNEEDDDDKIHFYFFDYSLAARFSPK